MAQDEDIKPEENMDFMTAAEKKRHEDLNKQMEDGGL